MDHSVLDAADAPLASLIDDATSIDDVFVLLERVGLELTRWQLITHSVFVLVEEPFCRPWTWSSTDETIVPGERLEKPEATVEGLCAIEGLERRMLASELRRPTFAGEPAVADLPLLSPVDGETAEILIIPLLSSRGSLGSWAVHATEELEDRAVSNARAIGAIVTMVLENLAVLQETDARQEQLANVRIELESTNAELETVARMASSELHQPLGQIRNYSNRLGDCGEQLTERELDYLARIKGASSRMQRLIADLLTFSRVSSADAPMAPVSLNQLVNEAIIDLELTIADVEGSVRVADLGIVAGNATQLRQLFQNLVGNAIKYRKENIAPTVEVRLGAPVHGYVSIEVEDNGIGFEPQFVDRIFKPFQRLHGRGTFEGSGIGLAVCRRIVERHGGELAARSEPGQGSTFIVTLKNESRS